MKVYVVVGLYGGLPDRIGVFVDEGVANDCKQDMEKEGLEVALFGPEEVDYTRKGGPE